MKPFLFAVISTVLIPSLSLAAPVFPSLEHNQENIFLSSPSLDDVYSASASLNISAPISGDAVLAGANISLTSNISEDLTVAGFSILSSGQIGDDIKAAGQTITLSGNVGDDAMLAGSSISLKDMTVGGSIFAAGENINVQNVTVIEGGKLMGENITFNAVSQGNLVIEAKNITFGPNAKIAGSLEYAGTTNIEPSTIVSGGVTQTESVFNKAEGFTNQIESHLPWVVAGAILWKILTLMIIGGLLWYALPFFFSKTARQIISNPLKSFGVGMLWFIGTPILAFILLFTLIGSIVGIFFAGIWALLFLIMGYVCTATLTAFIVQKTTWHGFWKTLLAVFLSAIIVSLPFTMLIIAPLVMGGLLLEKIEILKRYTL